MVTKLFRLPLNKYQIKAVVDISTRYHENLNLKEQTLVRKIASKRILDFVGTIY